MITVVTITYNNYEELVQTLDSLKPALNDQVESLVINGGTCEKTKSYLETYRGRSISEPDQGISDAFNKGVRNANGDYIAVLNSGDLLLYPDYYREALDLISSHPQLPYLYGSATFRHRYLGDISFVPQMELVYRQMPFAHSSMITSKAIMEEFGIFDLNYKIAMDYDLLIKIHQSGHRGIELKTPSAFLLDGTGVSSVNGLAGIEECTRTLKREGLLSLDNTLYFGLLRLKSHGRSFLGKLGLIGIYDRLRHGEKQST